MAGWNEEAIQELKNTIGEEISKTAMITSISDSHAT